MNWTSQEFAMGVLGLLDVFIRKKEGDIPRTMMINNLEIWVQLHGMGSGFMSQRVVTDVGNYIGKFVESDANNFVGVWREFLRVRVAIPLDKPLKRRMKLKKSDSNWCWVNFKYEGFPTFCFICGLVGHDDKFCERLFDMPEDKIEKPFGTWMRAEPRRRMHTMGSKWLRPGGAAPVKSKVDEAGNVADTESNGNEIIPEKIGIDTNRNLNEIALKGGDNSGGLLMQSTSCNNVLTNNQESKSDLNGKDKDVDLNEILITDPKRRRVDNAYGPQIQASPYTEMSLSPQEDVETNQKNLYLASAALQVRHSS